MSDITMYEVTGKVQHIPAGTQMVLTPAQAGVRHVAAVKGAGKNVYELQANTMFKRGEIIGLLDKAPKGAQLEEVQPEEKTKKPGKLTAAEGKELASLNKLGEEIGEEQTARKAELMAKLAGE